MLQLFSRRFGSRNAPNELKPGDRYIRTLGSRFLETATILELRHDPAGIDRVHFAVAVEQPDADPVDAGPRTLALSRFIDEYCTQVA